MTGTSTAGASAPNSHFSLYLWQMRKINIKKEKMYWDRAWSNENDRGI
jgi:hypothetical protein